MSRVFPDRQSYFSSGAESQSSAPSQKNSQGWPKQTSNTRLAWSGWHKTTNSGWVGLVTPTMMRATPCGLPVAGELKLGRAPSYVDPRTISRGAWDTTTRLSAPKNRSRHGAGAPTNPHTYQHKVHLENYRGMKT